MTADKKNSIQDEVAVWRSSRLRYPGWLVAPRNMRKHLHDFTINWLRPLQAFQGTLASEQRILTVFEASWRLDIALTPMQPSWIEIINQCISTTSPFSADVDPIEAESHLHRLDYRNANDKDVTQEMLRDAWIALAIVLLRVRRQEREHNAFATIEARLLRCTTLYPDCIAAISYERCLLALAELDDSRARDVLSKWPTNTSDPYWQVRRAAVLAELGDTDNALHVATDVLESLRYGHQQAAAPRIPELSREGWLLRLIQVLHFDRKLSGKGVEPDFSRRLRDLDEYSCNPNRDLEVINATLDQPEPRPKPRSTRRHGFQPDDVRTTIHLSDDLYDRVLPAYQFIRLAEVATLIPSFGNIQVAGKTLDRAVDWLAPYEPEFVLSHVCRRLNPEVTNRHLSRHGIAALAPDVIARLFKMAMNAVKDVCKWGVPSYSRISEQEKSREFKRLTAAIDLLSRVAIRLDKSDSAELWTLALSLYVAPGVRTSSTLPKHLNSLISSLSLATSDLEREERLLGVVALPFPGSSEFEVFHESDWPELAENFSSALKDVDARDERWTKIIRDLISTIEMPDASYAWRAMVRLIVLLDQRLLTDYEKKQVANFFWRTAKDGNDLPRVKGVNDFVVLRLLEPKPRISIDRFRKHALKEKLPKSNLQAHERIRNWLAATRRPIGGAELRAVPWSAAEAKRICDLIVEWWDGHGRKEVDEENETSYQGIFNSSVFGTVFEAQRALVEIVWPRAVRDPSLTKKLLTLLNDFETHGVPIGRVATILVASRSVNKVLELLLRELSSDDVRKCNSALDGIEYWIEALNEYEAMAAGSRLRRLKASAAQQFEAERAISVLVSAIATLILARKQPCLEEMIRMTNLILKHFPKVVDASCRRILVTAIGHLIEDVAYRSSLNDKSNISYYDVPSCRAAVARLVYLLLDLGTDIGESEKKWLDDAAVTDPLPEVRQAARGL